MKRIGFLDRKIFPENIAGFNSILNKDPYESVAGLIVPDKDETKRTYRITTKGLADELEEEKDKKVPIFRSEKQLSLEPYCWNEQLLFLIAAHEVRHRIQRDKNIEKFSPKDAKLIDDWLLQSIIEFYEIEFKEREKIYQRENKSNEFIKRKFNPAEFDATVIHCLVVNKMQEKFKKMKVPLQLKDYEEIVSMIVSAIQIAGPKKSENI